MKSASMPGSSSPACQPRAIIPSRGAALVELEASSFLEDVDYRIGITAQRQRASGISKRAQRSHAIAQVALRRRTRADLDVVEAQQRDIVVGQLNGVHGGEVRAEDALPIEELCGSAALDLQALLDLGKLFREMDVQGHTPILRVAENDAHRFGVDRAHAVDGGRDSYAVGVLQLVDAPRPSIGVTIRESLLRSLERPAVHSTT